MSRYIAGIGVVLTVLLIVGAARASPYWVEYEPANGHFPEQEGWERITWCGGDQRWLEDGWLVMDGMADARIVDYYEMRRLLDPGAGEQFVMRWRIRIDELQWYHDPGVGVFSDENWAVGFEMSLDRIESVFEDDVGAPFEPGVAHRFELRSPDMRSYVLSIDDVPAIHGALWDSLSNSAVSWGDAVSGGAALARWDYFGFGVVPECNSFVLANAATWALVLVRRRTWRRLVSRHMVLILFASLTLAVFAQANTTVIYQHNDYYNTPPGYYYEVNAPLREITVHHGVEGEVFEFEAVEWNGPLYVAPGDINLITADENAGVVELTVIGNINAQHDQPYGATNIMEITLNDTGVTGIMEELAISDNLGANGATEITSVAGSFYVGKTVETDVTVETVAAGGVFAPHIMDANLYVSGAGPHEGDIDIEFLYDNNVTITGTMEGLLEVGNHY
jgi:hypothetical protein